MGWETIISGKEYNPKINLLNSISITDQINTQYRDYALYVLQSRGIPNFYDSLTPVQRIILENSPATFHKTIGLVGEVIRTGLYHHGDSSLAGAISKLARPFGCSFSILEGDGFFGSPVNPNPSAPRYTSVRINRGVKEIIAQHADLNEQNEEGGHDWLHLEIPVGLLTHIIGIAVGYRTNILPRKLEDIVEFLQGKNKVLKPHFKDFSGKIYKYEDHENVWLLESGFEVNTQKKSVRIFDLPPVMRFDSFMEKIVKKMEHLGVDYKLNNNSQSKCDVTLWFYKSTAAEFTSLSQTLKKLTQILVKEDVVFIKDGEVRQFDSVKSYLEEFKFHLEQVKLKRLNRDVQNLVTELEFLEAKLKFLIYMSDSKRKNEEILEFLTQFNKSIFGRLASIQLIKLSTNHIVETQEEIKFIKEKIKETQKDIKVQESVVKLLRTVPVKKNPAALLVTPAHPIVKNLDSDIQIFEPSEEEQE